MDEELFEFPEDEKKTSDDGKIVLATVYAVDSSHGLTLIFDGQNSPSQKKYKLLMNGHTPEVGDRVAAVKHSGTYIVLGAIGTEGGGGGGGDTASPNTVYAGPASGSEPGEAAFRSLVAADLPGMSTDIISPDLHESSPPETGTFGEGIQFLDADGNRMGSIKPYMWADGSQTLKLLAEIDDGNNSRVNNYLEITKKKDGTIQYGLNAAAFLKALGLGTSAGALPISVVQGGTGMTDASVTFTKSVILECESGFTCSSAYAVKWGKICQLGVWLTNSSAVSSSTTTWATLNSGYRPRWTSYSQQNPSGSVVSISNYGKLTTAGGSIAAGTSICFIGTFILL